MDILAYIGITLLNTSLNRRITAGHRQEIPIMLMDLGVMLIRKEDGIVVIYLYVKVHLVQICLIGHIYKHRIIRIYTDMGKLQTLYAKLDTN
ncbi:hypothetical protein AM593_05694, partial [Mytilus galloprovincialis]